MKRFSIIIVLLLVSITGCSEGNRKINVSPELKIHFAEQVEKRYSVVMDENFSFLVHNGIVFERVYIQCHENENCYFRDPKDRTTIWLSVDGRPAEGEKSY